MFYLFRDVETKHHLRRNLCVRILEFDEKKHERKREKEKKQTQNECGNRSRRKKKVPTSEIKTIKTNHIRTMTQIK